MVNAFDKSPITEVQTLSISRAYSRRSDDAHFVLVLSGEVALQAGEERYDLGENTVFLVAPKEPFTLFSGGANLVLLVSLSGSFLAQGPSLRLGHYICNSSRDNDRDYAVLRQLLSRIALNRCEGDDLGGIREMELSCALLYYLSRYHYAANAPDNARGLGSRREQIMSYLERRYAEPVSLQELAAQTHVTPAYLSRYFKKSFGRNFSACLHDIRLSHALDDLCATDAPVTTVALSNGFSGVTPFNRLFKEHYGMTPQAYRRQHAASAPAPAADGAVRIDVREHEALEKQLQSIAAFEERSPETIPYPQRLTYHIEDVRQAAPVQPIWRSMINIGYSSNLSNSNIQAQLQIAQQEIGFKYGRIQSVLNDEVLPRLPGGQYNYSDFDRYIEMLLAIGLTPFLDLTFKQNYVFLSGSDIVYPAYYDQDMPNREKQFLEKLSALVRHCVNTFGSTEVGRWGFEIGYSHDEYLHLTETPAAFVRRFESGYRLIKSLLPDAPVGGPNHNITIDFSVFCSIANEMDRRGFSPDFISLCAFPYEIRPDAADFSRFVYAADPSFIISRVDQIKAALALHPRITQSVFITVFGADVKSRNHANDGCFQAAFLVRNTIALIGKVDALGYWQLSDIGTEYIDSTRILFGGTGILTKHSLKKPGFTALKRLSFISLQLLSVGDGWLAATNGINTYNVVLSNYIHFDELFCVNAVSGVPLENAYAIFKNPATRDISVVLDHLEPGRYKIITTVLNREYGSLLDAWVRYGIIDDLQPRDIHYFRDIVHPQRLARYVDCESGTLELHAQLLPHETRFIEILREL